MGMELNSLLKTTLSVQQCIFRHCLLMAIDNLAVSARRGAGFPTRNTMEGTAHEAALRRHVEVIKLLLGKGADISIRVKTEIHHYRASVWLYCKIT